MAAPRKKKIYEKDGLKFKSLELVRLYCQWKVYLAEGFIKSFTLPTIQEQKQKSKYGAMKCEIDGTVFDSVMEGKFYLYLKAAKKQGDIKKFEMQPEFMLQEGFTKNGKKVRPIVYIGDFLITFPDGGQTLVDVKGRETADFKLKRKMFDNRYRDLLLICVQYDAKADEWKDLEDIKREQRAKKKAAKLKEAS